MGGFSSGNPSSGIEIAIWREPELVVAAIALSGSCKNRGFFDFSLFFRPKILDDVLFKLCSSSEGQETQLLGGGSLVIRNSDRACMLSPLLFKKRFPSDFLDNLYILFDDLGSEFHRFNCLAELLCARVFPFAIFSLVESLVFGGISFSWVETTEISGFTWIEPFE